MAKIVRIRRGAEWYLGPDKRGRPEFAHVVRRDARVCLSEKSAQALLGMPGFDGAEVDVENTNEG